MLMIYMAVDISPPDWLRVLWYHMDSGSDGRWRSKVEGIQGPNMKFISSDQLHSENKIFSIQRTAKNPFVSFIRKIKWVFSQGLTDNCIRNFYSTVSFSCILQHRHYFLEGAINGLILFQYYDSIIILLFLLELLPYIIPYFISPIVFHIVPAL